MDQVDFALDHPKTGEPCLCTVWINGRHPAGPDANIAWHGVVRRAGQPEQVIGLHSTTLNAGALLLPTEALARALLAHKLG